MHGVRPITHCGRLWSWVSTLPSIVLLEADFEVGRCQTSDSATGVDLFHFGLLTAIIRLSPFVTNGDNRIDKELYPLATNGDNSVPSGYNPIDNPLSPLIGGIINCSST